MAKGANTMSGHSKWAQIKRQKGVNDTRRGQMFTKVGREISIAARAGGGDPDSNFRLRLALVKARQINMPQENIKRAIDRGAGGGDGAALEEANYEGYGPNGVAFFIEIATDSKNRAAAEVRNVFSKYGGNLGESGSVAWMFEPRGVITIEGKPDQLDELALTAIDMGALDFKVEDNELDIYTEVTDLSKVREGLTKLKANITGAERAMIPNTTLALDDDSAVKVLRLADHLEELDDVQKVYFNAEISGAAMEKYEG
jgi:YebC/PmpR family DNA-binding regulatory protein